MVVRRTGREEGRDKYHASKTLLASRIPELETNLEAVDMDLLGDEKGAAGGGGVFWVESVLGVSVKERGFAYARVAHDDDFRVDAMVVAGVDVGVHGGGEQSVPLSALPYKAIISRAGSPGSLHKTKCRVQSLQLHIYSCGTAGNSKVTSFPVRRRYTDENESSLYSSDVASFESRYLSDPNPSAPFDSNPPETGYIHFQQFGTIHSNTRPLANNLSGVDKILKDLFVHIRERTAARPLLLDSRIACRLAQHSALGDKNNMAIGKLLLQLSCQPVSLVNYP
jgi:hypothetical protein